MIQLKEIPEKLTIIAFFEYPASDLMESKKFLYTR